MLVIYTHTLPPLTPTILPKFEEFLTISSRYVSSKVWSIVWAVLVFMSLSRSKVAKQHGTFAKTIFHFVFLAQALMMLCMWAFCTPVGPLFEK